MAFKINSYTNINDDTSVTLGVFSTVASLPSGAPNGSTAFVSEDEQLYYKKTAGWSPITAKYGSVFKPATSAAQILSAGDSTGDGVYYISSSSGTIQTYCDMTNGGWMLVAKINTDQPQNNVWAWGGGYWSASSPVSETSCQDLSNTDALNRLYYEYNASSFRLCLGNKNNALTYNWSGTAKNLFTNGQKNTGFGRSAWLNWFATGTGQAASNFDNQPNCNAEGFCHTSASAVAMRFGITMNNEGDCNSNDSCIGFGTYSNNDTGGTRNIEAGGHRWSPDARYAAQGFIFVK
jgi:hypothetical protein